MTDPADLSAGCWLLSAGAGGHGWVDEVLTLELGWDPATGLLSSAEQCWVDADCYGPLMLTRC